MPDKTKLGVFVERGVRIQKTCGTCEHGTFQRGRFWGECALATYQHAKHAGVRQMPAHLSFVCPEYRSGDKQLMELGEYTQLVPWVGWVGERRKP